MTTLCRGCWQRYATGAFFCCTCRNRGIRNTGSLKRKQLQCAKFLVIDGMRPDLQHCHALKHVIVIDQDIGDSFTYDYSLLLLCSPPKAIPRLDLPLGAVLN